MFLVGHDSWLLGLVMVGLQVILYSLRHLWGLLCITGGSCLLLGNLFNVTVGSCLLVDGLFNAPGSSRLLLGSLFHVTGGSLLLGSLLGVTSGLLLRGPWTLVDLVFSRSLVGPLSW